MADPMRLDTENARPIIGSCSRSAAVNPKAEGRGKGTGKDIRMAVGVLGVAYTHFDTPICAPRAKSRSLSASSFSEQSMAHEDVVLCTVHGSTR